MITLNEFIDKKARQTIDLVLYLTADERQKAKQKLTRENQIIKLDFLRGAIFREGDLLTNELGNYIAEIKAKPEQVMTVTGNNQLDLMKACYHLGNRHISLEITDHYLRFSADHVLQSMLNKLGFNVVTEIAPFYPETGAYHHH